ncbi:MAG: paraquat-inducible protein A [Alphaproteobacteria bacterium]|nr:paraquat-inducible protein A [Alphaproteobacteria bacterium]
MSQTATPPELRECPGCGMFQVLPPLAPGMAARCSRCGTTLRRARTDPLGRGLALTLAALVLLTVMCTTTLMTVSTAGIVHGANLLSGPEELVRRDMSLLAVAVVFTTLIAPFGKLLATAYVLVGLRLKNPPRHLRRVFVLAERLRPWSMIDVFVFGVFVAYVKLGDIVHISLGIGVYALMCLTFVVVWSDAVLDPHAVWDALDREPAEGEPMRRAVPAHHRVSNAIGCETCGLVSAPVPHAVHHGAARCPRCASVLHARKPDSIARTWALVIAAAVLYIPANYYPVLTVMQLGAGAPSTILGGVEELFSSGMYPLAALVFFASIAVPMLKLVGLSAMLIATQLRRSARLRDRTRLSHVVRWIGRWSMIDIFMESLLGALVRFGTIVTIEPGAGAVAFCAVVILTMFAAETFDPRLMWDAAEEPAAGTAEAPAEAF